jgi:predicted nuclease of predicted toxin-antitoxin system
LKIKLDENMPTSFYNLLKATGHNVTSAAEENLFGADDPLLLKTAAAEGRILLTFDTDFADIRNYPAGSHFGIVVFRLRDQRWASVKKPAHRLIESDILARLNKGLAIVDETRIRIRVGTGGK